MNFDNDALRELAISLEKVGVVEPVIVREKEGRYEIIAGERRWRAALEIGMKELPAIVRKISDEEAFSLSLIENVHRKDLTDAERENAVHKLWKTGRFKTTSEMAAALGVSRSHISDDIDAWEFRNRNKTKENVPTYVIARTNGLEENERKQIISKFENEEFRAIDVYSVVKAVRNGSESLKKELLQKERSLISPEIAGAIIESLPRHSDQNEIIRVVKRHRLNATEVKNLAQKFHESRNGNDKPSDIVREIDSGYAFKCPVCSHVYKIFHNEPTKTHSFREMP
jgi:ParB/RepB/Spo0J family partition protein